VLPGHNFSSNFARDSTHPSMFLRCFYTKFVCSFSVASNLGRAVVGFRVPSIRLMRFAAHLSTKPPLENRAVLDTESREKVRDIILSHSYILLMGWDYIQIWEKAFLLATEENDYHTMRALKSVKRHLDPNSEVFLSNAASLSMLLLWQVLLGFSRGFHFFNLWGHNQSYPSTLRPWGRCELSRKSWQLRTYFSSVNYDCYFSLIGWSVATISSSYFRENEGCSNSL